MSVNIFNASLGKLMPLAGIPRETLNSKADSEMITPSENAEDTITATKAHTEGDYFEVNGALVKALDDIAIGDTLTEGINIETTNIGSELKRVDSSLAGKVSRNDFSTLSDKLTVVDPDEGSGMITFGVDSEGNYGYKKVGADTVTPFLTGGGSDVPISISTIDNNSYLTNGQVYSAETSVYGDRVVLDLSSPLQLSKGRYLIINGCTNINQVIINGNSVPVTRVGALGLKPNLYCHEFTTDGGSLSSIRTVSGSRIYGFSSGDSGSYYNFKVWSALIKIG